MGQGLVSAGGNPASPPYRNGPYNWDQQVNFSQNGNGEGSVWWVDGTNGLDANNGKGWATAKKTIQAAVTIAGAGDTIFITAKLITDATGDPANYDETIIIPFGTHSLSLIGISRGRTQGGLPQIKIGAGTTAMLTVRSAGCLIANLGFNGASSTGGGILLDDDNSTKTAFGTSIIGCHFKNCKKHATDGRLGGAIMWTSEGNAWQVLIDGCRFYKNLADIVLIGTSNTRPQDITIQNCDFTGIKDNTDVNIWGTGAGSGFGSINIDNCKFGQLPAISSGSVLRYMDLTGTLNGMVTNCTFGCITDQAGTELTFKATGTGAKIPTTVHIVRSYGQTITDGVTGEINIS